MKNVFLALVVIFAGIMVGAPSEAAARSVIRMDDTVSLSEDQVVEGDFYGAGTTAVVLSGTMGGDAYVAGSRVTFNGSVASDTLAVGVSVDVHGDVGDDMRVVAGDVTIASHVRGDLVVFARRLEVLSTARIDGDVIFFGQEAEISGVVGHDVMGSMTKLRLDGPVGGAVDVSVGALTLGDKAEIKGDVMYASTQELIRAANATISGAVVKNDANKDTSSKTALRSILEVTLPLLFAVLCWYLFMRNSLEHLVRSATTSYVRVALIGLAAFAAFPTAAMILLVSGLGAILGWIVLVSYLSLVCIAVVGSVAVAGGFVRMALTPKRTFGLPWLVVGAAVFGCFLFFPYGGAILIFLLIIITLGALVERIYHSLR